MAIRDLLVHLDGSRRDADRLAYAIAWAARDDAHLIGLYTLDLVPTLAELAGANPGRVEQFEIYSRLRTAELARAKETEGQFREALRRADLRGEWRFVEDQSAAAAVTLHTRYVDLAVVGQVDPANPGSGTNPLIPEEALLASGRPLVIMPYAGKFETIGRRVIVGWKPTREAARAVADACPILERADKVIILSVNPERGADAESGLAGADIALHLARHGIRVEARSTIADDIATGDVLLNEVSDNGADLLVIGGYGHPRVREAMFGGVTRHILHNMTVPVLMSH
jgi:nucleotide-binding universal stress UspA family protein